MLKRVAFLTIISLLVCQWSLKAQPSEGGTPPGLTLKNLPAAYDSRVLNKPNLELVQAEDLMRDKNGVFYRAGVSVPVQLDLENSGTWTDLPNGDRIWRLMITAPDALALGVYYDRFWLPPGGKLYLYNPAGDQILGAYTEKNNTGDSPFVTELVKGEALTLEYLEPSRTRGRAMISISEIAYVYRGIKQTSGQAKDFGSSESCEVNINCPEGDNWQVQKKGVARIFLKAGVNYGWCSGSLVNNVNQDCTPYFLTADHCGNESSTADLNVWVFYFNYEAPTCSYSGSEPSSNTLTGCTLKAHAGDGGNTGSDFFLVQLSSAPTFNPYFNGWDRSTTPATGGVGIHHPAGDIMKISTFTGTLASDSWGSASGSHWKVTWTATTTNHGVTEAGSSGSSLFNNAGLIVGDLTGGGSLCTSVNSPDMYGKFSYSWDQNGTTAATRLKDWLDPNNTGVMTLNGFYCGSTPTLNADFTASALNIPVGGSVDFTDLSTGSPTSWSWTFNGGTPGSSSLQNPTGIIYNTAGVYTVSLTIGDGTSTDTETKSGYIIVGGTTPPGDDPCDTLNYPLNGTEIFYSVLYPDGGYGYVSGNNGYSDSAKANYYLSSASYPKFNGAYFKFGKAKKHSGGDEKIVFAVWDNSGLGGRPGATPVLTDTLMLSTIISQVNTHQMTWVDFEEYVFSTPFYIGVYLPREIGDTLALITNKNGETVPSNAWEQWQNGNWYNYNETTSWGYDLSHAIFPIVCSADFNVDELNRGDHVMVYPNPANHYINVDFGDVLYEKVVIRVFNLMGALVSTAQYDGSAGNIIRVNTADFTPGIYTLQISTGDLNVVRKISVIK